MYKKCTCTYSSFMYTLFGGTLNKPYLLNILNYNQQFTNNHLTYNNVSSDIQYYSENKFST